MIETIVNILVLVGAACLVLFLGGIVLNKRMHEDRDNNSEP